MAHKGKYARGAIGHLTAHYERKKDENGEYIKFKNQDIDATRTHLNYNLAPEHEGGQVAFIQKRVSEVRCQNRADVNLMCTWIVTMPKPLTEGQYARLDDNVISFGRYELEALFFERTYRFLADRYGEQNIISAYVHMDEGTPHMHFAFVPVVVDKKRNDYKVSAKEAIDLQDLKAFHTDLERFHDHFGDWKFEVINEATKDGNKTVAELKKENYRNEVEMARQEAAESRISADSVANELIHLESQKKNIEDEIVALQTKKETLTAEEIAALKGTKTLTGALKGVTYSEYEALRTTVQKSQIEATEWREKAETAEKTVTQLCHENDSLKHEVGRLQTAFKSMFRFLEQFFPDALRKFKELLNPPKKQMSMDDYKTLIEQERAKTTSNPADRPPRPLQRHQEREH